MDVKYQIQNRSDINNVGCCYCRQDTDLIKKPYYLPLEERYCSKCGRAHYIRDANSMNTLIRNFGVIHQPAKGTFDYDQANIEYRRSDAYLRFDGR